MAASLDESVHQGVTIPVRGGSTGVGQSGDVAVGTHVVAGLPHRGQQCHRTGRSVQSHRVPDPGVLGGVRGEHEGDPAFTGGDGTKFCVPQRDTRHPSAALRVGNIGDEAVAVDLLEREGHGDDAPVEFGHRDLSGDVQRTHAVVVGLPITSGAGQAQPLQNRDIKGGKMADIPLIVSSSGSHSRRGRAARGQHGDHHRVSGGERLQEFRRRGA